MHEAHLNSLTSAQRAAVEHIDGPLLILAGPGSGKTRVVTHRIANLLHQGVSAYRILALTFTNKAADEMRSRLERLAPHERVWMGTFHRFCSRLLRQYAARIGLEENFSIYDIDDSGKVLRQALQEEALELSHVSPAGIASEISWAKNNLIGPDAYEPRSGSPLGRMVQRVYPKYQQLLLAANAVDFDDLLMHVAFLLRENAELRAELDERYQYILVDEYQDTNLAQYAIVRSLSIDYPNLAVTGDPDQSIYGWRGANLNNILDFERDFGRVKTVRLEQNYRSTKAILRVADALIRHNKRRKQKDLFTENDEGLPVRLGTFSNQMDEAEHIAARIAHDVAEGRRRARDFAVFYRVNALSRSLEHALRAYGVPYQIVNGLEFYQRKEIKDMLAYLKLINNPRDTQALERIINVPTRGIGKGTLQKLHEYAGQRQLSVLDAARQAGLIPGLSKKSAVSVARFVSLVDRLRVHATQSVQDVLLAVLNETGYRELLIASEAEEDQDRLANIEELLTAAREFDIQHPGDGHLQDFLEQSSLASDTDALETETDNVTLMTLHAAKGLEFPVVYIVAVENDLIPHERSAHDSAKREEERRLLFVGITRAQEELTLSHVDRRQYRGRDVMPIPSDFLMELPRSEMEFISSARLDSDDRTARQRRFGAAEPDFGDAYEASDSAVDITWDDADFLQDVPSRQTNKFSGEMQTAADMFAADLETAGAPRRASPTVFRRGMHVEHPEYGGGVIVSLSGASHARVAEVRFHSDGETRKFRLAHAPLAPVLDE